VSAWLVALPVYAQEICWVERIEQGRSGELSVFLKSGAVAGIKRRSGASEYYWGKGLRTFSVAEGDVANILGGAHDGCTAEAVVRDNRLGVQLNATSCPPGLPCVKASSFVLPAK
jgi:hypothetical protein